MIDFVVCELMPTYFMKQKDLVLEDFKRKKERERKRE